MRLRYGLLLVLVLAMVAAACGDSSEDTEAPPPETVIVEVPGETVVVETPGETVVVETPGETVVRPGTTIKFWSTETQPERLAITQGIIDEFTAATGIAVQLTATDEDQLPELMITNAASGTLPDVVFHPIDFTIGWAGQGLLNTEAANEVVNNLDPGTFSTGALALATVDGTVAAVPSDGWGQLLVYRKDLFDAAGLAAPNTFENILAAAEALHDPGNDFYGITASNDGGAVFTQQTYEHFALANGCQLVDSSGTVTLDSANCVESIDFYTSLLDNYSPPGLQDVVSTRATYFAGQAAMIVWSPFILDEMAGLRDAAFPSCPECEADPAFLAKNSALMPAFSGPSGSMSAQYGQISYMGLGNTGDAERTVAAQAFVEYWLSDGYLGWLSTSPEGKFPMRRGTTENPTLFLEGWAQLETGVDRRAPLSDFYPEEVLTALIQGTEGFDRWGFVQGEGELVTAVYQTLPVPRAIVDVLDGSLTAEEAAVETQAAAEAELALINEE
jgi:multiple sugar transport system substrate-binding protein